MSGLSLRFQHSSPLSVTQLKVAFEPSTTTMLRGPSVISPALTETQTHNITRYSSRLCRPRLCRPKLCRPRLVSFHFSTSTVLARRIRHSRSLADDCSVSSLGTPSPRAAFKWQCKFQTEDNAPTTVGVRKLDWLPLTSAVQCLILSESTRVTDGQNYDS